MKKIDKIIGSLCAQRSNTEKSLDGLKIEAYTNELNNELEKEYFCHIHNIEGYVEGIKYSINLIRDQLYKNNNYIPFYVNQNIEPLDKSKFNQHIEEALEEYSLSSKSINTAENNVLKSILRKLVKDSYNLKKNSEVLYSLNFKSESKVNTEEMLELIIDHINMQGFVQGLFWAFEILSEDIKEVEKYNDLKSYLFDFKKYVSYTEEQHKQNIKYLKDLEESQDLCFIDQVI